jgi:phage/plasmid primase-like uncharacterized protein
MPDGFPPPTSAVKALAMGRELEVLDALGIRWRKGRPHIRCPYPAHADHHPSWRWDQKVAKARCACSSSDNIFDVVMKMEGLDFAAAKIRIARLLNRPNLIDESNSGRPFQPMDATSLLQPPPPQRDDKLPLTYLARRLGIDVATVPRPSTPVAGWKSLPYFDLPGPRIKPKLVGSYPCAVFGTLAADGRRHAHRIHVHFSGQGKADLGLGPDGRPRAAKKSAPLQPGRTASGCTVLWGNPNQALQLILCEGVETAAAVAFAFSAEIETCSIAVAAAVHAAGVEAFESWPAARHVIIAADRDEAAKEDGRPGSRRGERAARTFGLHHHNRTQVAIALPGQPGESTDWLDVLLREGPDAVRKAVMSAETFVPTEREREA